MRALITGFAGFVGSHLAEYLLANTDWEIVGMMRWGDPIDNIQDLVSKINRNDGIKVVNADLNDAVGMRSVVRESRPTHIFHLAAQSFPGTSFTSPCETIQTNVVGTMNLMESIRDEAPHALIHVCSSSEVYGKVGKDNVPIKETCTFHPASPYAISKVGTDMLGRFYAEAYGLNSLTTRMFTHTGPRRGDVFFESTFAKQIAMIEAGQLKPPLKVGNLNSFRTIADVRDAVRAYHMLLTVNPIPGEVYNIGGTHSCTVGEVLEALFDAAGFKCEVEVDPARLRPLDADLQVPDCSKFKEHTGWEPQIPFEQTISDLMQYWRERVKREVPLQR